MRNNDASNNGPDSADEKPFKTVFLSYRYADLSRFEIVQQVAVRLRFFAIDVVLDQRSVDYGADIKEFMRRELQRVDAIILVITEDYNQALLASSGPGEGVRFEVQAALHEKSMRPHFQIIPLLLHGVRPIPPFDQMKCATPEAIDDVVAQLGLPAVSGGSRILRQRYRIDRLVETRGVARIFYGWDMVTDLPIEVYLVPAMDPDATHRFDLFERVVRGRSSAFSPFLLNVRDTYIDSHGGFYLITERFEGTDLGVPLARGETTHPFGALCLAFQVSLALHELHGAGVVHGGLAPRCVRLNTAQTSCKIVDFEYATPLTFCSRSVGTLEGYPQLMPPERCVGSPTTVRQDIYQIGNLVLCLIVGRPALSRSAAVAFPWRPAAVPWQDSSVLEVEAPRFEAHLLDELKRAVTSRPHPDIVENTWLHERIRKTSSRRVLAKELAPLLAWCLAPRAEDRPQSCLELAVALSSFGIPAVGHLIDPQGIPVCRSLFPLSGCA